MGKREASKNEKRMMVQWFYRSSEIHKGKKTEKKCDPKEMMLSTAHDWNPLDSIVGLCVVAHHDEVKDWAMVQTQADVYFYRKLYNPNNKQLVLVSLDEAPKSAFTKVGLEKKNTTDKKK